ncbi:MAG: TIGR03086 family metal-binding protein [Acidimicrobiia bacterium]
MDLATYHRRACGEFDKRVTRVSSDAWARSTPCTDWDVRALVNHNTAENLWVPELLAGRSLESVGDRFEGDVGGANPGGAWQATARAAVAAVDAAANRFDEKVRLSAGDMPIGEYVTQRGFDLLVHAWDLARALGGDEGLPSDLVESSWEWAAPQVDAFAGTPFFGPPVRVPDDAPIQDRLLGLTGRHP